MIKAKFATLPAALQHWATHTPNNRLLADGTVALSYRETTEHVDRLAGGLIGLGLQPGDRIAVVMASGLDYALVWLAAARAGLIGAYINPAHVGEVLAHQLGLADPKVVIADAANLAAIELALPNFPGQIVLREPDAADRLSLHDLLLTHRCTTPLPGPSDVMALYFTSGTTCPSKAVIYTHAQAMATARPMAEVLEADDVLFWFNPMFHVALPHFVGASILADASVEITANFSARTFWDEARRRKVTATMMLGVVAGLLAAQPQRAGDRDHTLRKVFMVPLLDRLSEFEERFGVRTMSWFNMTEVATPIHTHGFARTDPVSCGYLREGVEARIVTDDDTPLPDGVAGELVLRPSRPFEFSPGYWRDPSATVTAWRNLWFHTGDMFVREVDGRFRFVDRKKDVIRRRGENIAATEVERAINAHAAVRECAVLGVPSSIGEEDVLAVVVIDIDAGLQPQDLVAHIKPLIAAHMVPRYLRITTDPLPKTPTGKVRKGPLREIGAAGSWDRGDRTNAGL